MKTSADLSPSFMIGWSQKENLIYIAVIVRDDVEVGGSGPSYTDGCEVYTEGTNEGKVVPPNFGSDFIPGNMAAIEYAMCVSDGRFDLKARLEQDNPMLAGGDISKTRMRAAYSREGDISVYEWAVEIYDSYPDAPTVLVPGKTIGLDVVVDDNDSDREKKREGYTYGVLKKSAWVCWGPCKPLKFFNANTLGDVLLTAEP